MNNKITITATDGKVFTGTIDGYTDLVEELNAYESDLRLKKQEEEVERRRKEEAKKSCVENLNNCITLMNKAIEDYTNTTGENLQFVTEDGKLAIRKHDEYSDWLDFFMKI